MKKLLLVLVLALPMFAQAQDTPKTKFYAMHWSAAKCSELAAMNGESVGLCGQGVEVFIITTDRSIALYRVSVNYVDAAGKAGIVTRYFSAADFYSKDSTSATTMAWIDLADVTPGDVQVVPFAVQGVASHQ